MMTIPPFEWMLAGIVLVLGAYAVAGYFSLMLLDIRARQPWLGA